MIHSEGWQTITITAALGAGISAGVFFAFSTFVMRGLDQLPAAQSISAMQAINRTAINPGFMTALFGTGALAVALSARAIADIHRPGAAWSLAGSALHVGALVLTGAYHVPRNDALAAVDPAAAAAPHLWSTYFREWTTANHVRTLLCAGAAGALLRAALRE